MKKQMTKVRVWKKNTAEKRSGLGRRGGSVSLGRACSPAEPAEVRLNSPALWLAERNAALSPPPLKKEVQQERQTQTAQDLTTEAAFFQSST